MDITKANAGELMNKRVKTVGETTTLLAAVKTMRESNVSSLVIEPGFDGDAWGIITRKDAVEAFFARAIRTGSQTVGDVMTKPAFVINPSLAVTHCVQMMRMVGIRRLPVVDGDQLVGILSNTDLFEYFAEQPG